MSSYPSNFRFTVSSGANLSGPANGLTTVANVLAVNFPSNSDDVFSRLGQRLVAAREEALQNGRPTQEAELVMGEDEWLELSNALKLHTQRTEPVKVWGIPVRVDWKPGTMAARRRLDKEEAVRELLAMVRELGE